MTAVRHPFDEAPSPGQCQSWVSAVEHVALPPSQFERIALLSGRLAARDGDLARVLLASACPVNKHGCDVLRPLWAQEAVHRAHGFMRLIAERNSREWTVNENLISAGVQDFAARDLAARFRELETSMERAVQPCSTVLENVVADLGVLFGCPANVTLKAEIDRVYLPGYKRRALVLAACELICNAMRHAFPGREAGVIEIGLTLWDGRAACLRVADDGIGLGDVAPNFGRGMAAALADLLEADLYYDRRAGWTIAEIVFPVHGGWHADRVIKKAARDWSDDSRDLRANGNGRTSIGL
jgi:two-component sensor histidine kinase